jgi:hypothetical protein
MFPSNSIAPAALTDAYRFSFFPHSLFMHPINFKKFILFVCASLSAISAIVVSVVTKCQLPFFQCSGSMTFWCGSGSADPCSDYWIRIRMRGDPDPAIFIIDLQDVNKQLIFLTKFFCLLLSDGTFTSFFKDKKSKRSHKTIGIKVFPTIFAS